MFDPQPMVSHLLFGTVVRWQGIDVTWLPVASSTHPEATQRYGVQVSEPVTSSTQRSSGVPLGKGQLCAQEVAPPLQVLPVVARAQANGMSRVIPDVTQAPATQMRAVHVPGCEPLSLHSPA